MSHRLRILHLSDLHERVALEWMTEKRKAKIRANAASRYRVLGDGHFFDKLAELANVAPIDLICFTGDVADWGLPEEYAAATQRFQQIRNTTGVPFERFFVIPGNHDIQRKTEKNTWNKMRTLAGNHDSCTALSSWMAGLEKPFGAVEGWRDKLLQRNAAFWSWVADDLRQTALLPASNPHQRLGYRVAVSGLERLPFPVTVVGLDSAWLCGNDNDMGRLLLTGKQVDLLTCDSEGKPLAGFRLALVHHPLSELADGNHCRQLLADTVDVVLRGHQHEPIAEEFSDLDRSLRVLAAGSLYEGDKEDSWINGFHLIDVQLNDSGRPLRYDLEFWGWSPRGLHWHHDDGVYRNTESGRATWWTALGKAERDAEVTRRRLEKSLDDLKKHEIFIGRDSQMKALESSLLRTNGATACAISSVQGMGGVGKSYLAAEFIGRHAGRFPGGVERLILAREDARDFGALLNDFCDILSLRMHDPEKRALLLRERLLSPPTLLLIENVDGHAQAHAVGELVARLEGCRVLITGRYRRLGDSRRWEQVDIQPFDEAEALEQLTKEYREPASTEEAAEFRELAGTLGHLPLAIHIAAGYLRRPGQTCAGFLKRMRDAGWNQGPCDPADPAAADRAKGVLAQVFYISFTALKSCFGNRGDDMFAAFCRLGFAPPAGFGVSLGAAIAGLVGGDFESLAVEACALSILDIDADPARPSSHRFRVHPLLAELLQPKADETRVLADMTDWFSERFGEAERWNEIHAEHPALTAWLRRITKSANEGTLPEVEIVRIERSSSAFAISCGPFQLWAAFCAVALARCAAEQAKSNILWTLSNVAQRAGDVKQMETAAREKLGLDRAAGRERGAALANGLIADILSSRGDLDEALRIRKEEQLPVFERLGDVRSRAVTMGQICDILEARGDLDEALRIRKEEVLPTFQKLGDPRLCAVEKGRIADILSARGDLDEALRIRKEEELPVYERLGDVRERAVTMGKIADILEARGDLDEALRIRKEEQLPVYERLGAVRSRAVTMGKIADILSARGDFDEALRALRDECLPAFERLGDVRERAVTMGMIADILSARGDLDEALRIRKEEQLPVYERLGDVREWAVTMGKIADVLSARGDLDEALRIRKEEELPVYERLGDVRSRAVTMGKIADILSARGEFDEAIRIRKMEEHPTYENLGDLVN
ncbi:MAG: metallophosphoesterase, partial [Candidatus Hydrogenedentes bacterium]|nr:metallophosphoesterase [Candidatus Hydrogenedentota bacterium]